MSEKFFISEAKTKEELKECWPALNELTLPRLTEEEFIEVYEERFRNDEYVLLAARDGEGGPVLGIIGFRVYSSLYYGRYLYIDVLATIPEARKRGVAGNLIDRVIEHGREIGVDMINLDSNLGRYNAHRLYMNKGFRIVELHFEKVL